jgi:predicted alpha-1,2-mannosidase
VVDAYLKGFDGFDHELAYEAIKASALLDFEGAGFIMEGEIIPYDEEVESVAKAMEYAISDWAIAQMAKKMGKEEDYNYFSKRASYYKHYFDKETRFMRGKTADGNWNPNFNPFASTHRQDDYCEGNAWQYTWLAPQDPEGLIELFEGEENFVQKLDSLFIVSSDKMTGSSPDISGFIGQYAHGNEPGHHIIYLYTYAGMQWKTAELANEIMTTMYSDQPDGLCGNEDCGQMSAWYMFNAFGFYSVNPANGAYVFGSPLFDEVEIDLQNDKTFTVKTQNRSDKNIYIQSVQLNGEPYEKTFITHTDIVSGGELQFVMGSEPNKSFGSAMESRPKSRVY